MQSFLQVLDSQRNLFQGELDLTRLRQRELASIVQLYRALGGGWEAVDLVSARSTNPERDCVAGERADGNHAGRPCRVSR